MVDEIDVNRRIVYKRNPDYWGKDLPINRGAAQLRHHPRRVFRRRHRGLRGVQGGRVHLPREGDSKKWATGL
jgi:microcin C transport system substrate-binding protein